MLPCEFVLGESEGELCSMLLLKLGAMSAARRARLGRSVPEILEPGEKGTCILHVRNKRFTPLERIRVSIWLLP